MPSVRVSEEVYEKLCELQARLQMVRRRRVSLSEVIAYLLDRHESLLSEEDVRELRATKESGDLKKYASKLAMAYAVIKHVSWSEVSEELRKHCGGDVDSNDDGVISRIVTYLEEKLGLRA